MSPRLSTMCAAVGVAAALAFGSTSPGAAQTGDSTAARSDTARSARRIPVRKDTSPLDTASSSGALATPRDTTGGVRSDTLPLRSDTVRTDTSTTPLDTTSVQRDTSMLRSDTTVQRDTSVRSDTSMVPQRDTITPPTDTSMMPRDTTALPRDTTALPRDTTTVRDSTGAAAPTARTAAGSDTLGTSGSERSGFLGRGLYIGVAGGASVPTGDFRDGYKTGWNVTVPIGWRSASTPWGVQLDLSYDRANGKTLATVGGTPYSLSNTNIWSGMLDLTFHIPLGASRAGLYLVGGGGVHHFTDYGGVNAGAGTVIPATSDVTKFGLNGGGGLSFAVAQSVDIYVESRYVSVFTEGKNTNYVPIIAGLRFF